MRSFEETEIRIKSDFWKNVNSPEGIRYLKIRTLVDKPSFQSQNFLSFIQSHSISYEKTTRQVLIEIRKALFEDVELTDAELDRILRKVYDEVFPPVAEETKTSLKNIAKNGDKFWKSWNGIFRDDIRAHVQYQYVRDPKIKNLTDLLNKIGKQLTEEVEGYTVISWFNQWSSAVIERIILKHPKIIPTVRRIENVDFFFKNIPIDLKTTFIPKEYLRKRCKNEKKTAKEIIEEVKKNPTDLIKWYYENQGENRFGADNRLFIVLINSENPEESWRLKAEFELIEKEVNEYFSKSKNLPLVRWSYHGKKISGDYETYSDTIIISKN